MDAAVQMHRPVSPTLLGRLAQQRAGGSSLEPPDMLLEASEAVRKHLNAEKPEAARRIERRFRVPTCGHLWPGIFWVACVVVPETGSLDRWIMPTDHEVWQIRSFIDYKLSKFFTEPASTQLRKAALPAYGGHNTIIFCKYPDVPAEGMIASARGWGYRMQTWRDSGAWPHSYGVLERDRQKLPDHPLTLVEAMDHRERLTDKPNPKWEAWKATHPSIFPAQA